MGVTGGQRPTRPSGAVRRDFVAYLHWRDYFGRDFDPFGDAPVARSADGVPALKAFASADSTGRLPPTCQPQLLRAAIKGKELLNWQIKSWAAGLADGLRMGGAMAFVAAIELKELAEALPWLPGWVWKATWAQALKLGRHGEEWRPSWPKN